MRRCRLRRARYIGHAKTALQHIFTATALNFVHVGEWLAGTPLAKTRRSSLIQFRPLPEFANRITFDEGRTLTRFLCSGRPNMLKIFSVLSVLSS